MKLHLFTIVLDGMPFLPMQLATFNRLSWDWHWHIVEGAARNVNCTGWCKTQYPRLSTDGSHEFIESLKDHPRVHVLWGKDWKGGKVEMCNAAIEHIDEPCVLVEADMDELWLPEQLDRIADVFSRTPPQNLNCMRFFCRYFVGPNIVTTIEDSYGNNPGEWLRAWRFEPGMTFVKHEPPVLDWVNTRPGFERCMTRCETRSKGLVFDHWSYVFESQLAYKEGFYGYQDAVAHWTRLQQHQGPWPVTLKNYLPWVDNQAKAGLLHKPEHRMARCPGDGQP